MKSRSPRRRGFVGWGLVAAGALVLALGVAGGVSFAYFTVSGSGSGSGGVGTLQPVTVLHATAVPSADLIPGGSSDLSVLLGNPNGYSVTIVSISQDGPATVVGGSGCTASNSGVSVPTRSGLDISLPSGPSLPVDFPDGVSMTTSSNTGCQGASFEVPVTVTVQR